MGVVVALALTRFMDALLFGVEPTDPVTFVAVSVVLLSSAVAAAWVPARRAAGIDPAEALRADQVGS